MTACSVVPIPANATFEALKAGLDARAGGRIIALQNDALPTGVPDLDRALGGGLPRGTLATLEGQGCSGRSAVLGALLAGVTHRSLAAVVEGSFAGEAGVLYPPDLERAGVVLERTLFVQAHTPVEVARCADILLRSKAFAVVVVPAVRLRATVWSRLCGLAQKSGALLLVLGMFAGTELAYFASTRVRCGIDRVVWSQRGVFGELAGYEMNAHVLKHRRAAPGAVAHVRVGAG